ncbi:MAG: type II toxin-antitoxin system death-on-curing family toxin [Nocardioidaceae bacterium]|nr:type II toxin-antitoxin system death-on-curing family toxin [Nocardioidaceae bacterium]
MSGPNYLSLPELIFTAERTLGQVEIADIGLLESALARPQATAFGADAYPTLLEKAAALTHSLAKNHALVDGNKRLTLAGLIGFLGINGLRLTWDNDAAYDFVIEIADGRLDTVAAIADRLGAAVERHTF